MHRILKPVIACIMFSLPFQADGWSSEAGPGRRHPFPPSALKSICEPAVRELKISDRWFSHAERGKREVGVWGVGEGELSSYQLKDFPRSLPPSLPSLVHRERERKCVEPELSNSRRWWRGWGGEGIPRGRLIGGGSVRYKQKWPPYDPPYTADQWASIFFFSLSSFFFLFSPSFLYSHWICASRSIEFILMSVCVRPVLR